MGLLLSPSTVIYLSYDFRVFEGQDMDIMFHDISFLRLFLEPF